MNGEPRLATELEHLELQIKSAKALDSVLAEFFKHFMSVKFDYIVYPHSKGQYFVFGKAFCVIKVTCNDNNNHIYRYLFDAERETLCFISYATFKALIVDRRIYPSFLPDQMVDWIYG